MSSDYDAAEFIDGDLEGQPSTQSPAGAGAVSFARAPTREEIDSKVAEAQQKLAELRRTQEGLERERAALEETRRRQIEFHTSRQEMIQNLTRGVGLLKETEFTTRRDADQIAKTLADLHAALAKIEAIHEDTWGQDSFGLELTRALTTLENARMEWNAARLKFEVLSGTANAAPAGTPFADANKVSLLSNCSLSELCRLGFALSWPIAAVLLLGFLLLLVLQLRR